MTVSPGSGPAGDPVPALRHAAEELASQGHAVVALDRAGRITFWNERATSLSGWAPQTAVGRPFYDLLAGRSRLALIEGVDLLAAGRHWQTDLDLEGPSGRAMRVALSAEPVREGGAVAGSVVVLRSLSSTETDRRLQELAAVLASVPDAVVVVDAHALVREWNPAAEAMFGWTRLQMLGAPAARLVPPSELSSFQAVWARIVAGSEVLPYEARRLDRDGGLRVVSVHAAGYQDNGTFAGAVATFREFSARQHDDRLLADLLGEVPVVVAVYDDQACVILAAGGGYLRAGVAPALAHGTALLTTLPNGDALHQAISASLRGATSQLQVLFDERIWQCHVAPLGTGGFVSAVDVTAEQILDDQLQVLLTAAPLSFVTFDARARITHAAGSALTTLGLDPEDLIGHGMADLYGDDPQLTEAVGRCLTGQRVDLTVNYRDRLWDLHYRSYPDRTGAVVGGVCIGQDTTSWHAPTAIPQPTDRSGPERVRGPLERDELTGLPGRRGIQRRLDTPVPAGLTRAVAVLDLDDFSLVADSHGRDAADLVLQVISGRLLTHCRSAHVGRWEADRFVVVLDAADPREQLSDLIDTAAAAVSEPVVLPNARLHLSASIGLAVSDDLPAGELFRAAEQALHHARADGRGHLCWFSPGMRPARGGLRLVKQLREALAHDQLRLHYQPLVAIATRRPVAVEALIRWQHPTEGLLLPAAFVPVAERTGLIHDLGRWVANRACREAVSLAQGGTQLRIAINVSARQLVERGLVPMLAEVMAETGCPASSLTVEVTETAVTTDLDLAVATLEQLKGLGVGLALDDFGTGYSSLLYLKHFPVDTLKIDRSFIAGLGASPDDTAIVASTISLAHSVGVQCVAEGVETVEQHSLLRSMGCDLAQGYLFSRALTDEQLTHWLTEHSSTPPQRPRPVRAPPPPETSDILRMHAEGASLNTIAAALNLSGRRTSRGTRWHAQSVAAIVARSAYPTLNLGDDQPP